MDIPAIRARAARWAEHDSKVPYCDDRRAARNGTNPAGRRPHTITEPRRLVAANDNDKGDDAAVS
jgi:hypothetical protein